MLAMWNPRREKEIVKYSWKPVWTAFGCVALVSWVQIDWPAQILSAETGVAAPLSPAVSDFPGLTPEFIGWDWTLYNLNFAILRGSVCLQMRCEIMSKIKLILNQGGTTFDICYQHKGDTESFCSFVTSGLPYTISIIFVFWQNKLQIISSGLFLASLLI